MMSQFIIPNFEKSGDSVNLFSLLPFSWIEETFVCPNLMKGGIFSSLIRGSLFGDMTYLEISHAPKIDLRCIAEAY